MTVSHLHLAQPIICPHQVHLLYLLPRHLVERWILAPNTPVTSADLSTISFTPYAGFPTPTYPTFPMTTNQLVAMPYMLPTYYGTYY